MLIFLDIQFSMSFSRFKFIDVRLKSCSLCIELYSAMHYNIFFFFYHHLQNICTKFVCLLIYYQECNILSSLSLSSKQLLDGMRTHDIVMYIAVNLIERVQDNTTILRKCNTNHLLWFHRISYSSQLISMHILFLCWRISIVYVYFCYLLMVLKQELLSESWLSKKYLTLRKKKPQKIK